MSRTRRETHDSPTRSVQFNVPAIAGVIALAVAAGLGAYGLSGYHERRMDREAVDTARRLDAAGESDLAVRHLNQHLARRPTDLAALGLKSEILADTAKAPSQVLDAAKVHEQFLRAAPNDPSSQAVRRRLIRLYLAYGELLQSLAGSQLGNEVIALESRYHAAEILARQLMARGATDTEAHRLLAVSLDGMAVPADARAVDAAVQEYRKVLSLDPSDAEAAERLAKLYTGRLNDPVRAERALDDALRANPGSVPLRLARHRFFVRLRRDAKAGAELDEAIKLAPGDTNVLVAAAEDALRRGNPDAARGYLGRVPEASRDDLRVVMTRGMIDFADERPDEAVDAWRRGLSATAGTDHQMAWWLAYALLQMDRVAEAVPLINQYRRLTGGDTPLLRLLQAQFDERTGRPALAIALLDQIGSRLDARWGGLVQMARGRCFEALFDDSKAMAAYGKARDDDPTAVAPRLSVARLWLKTRPDEAAAEVRRGLTAVPDDPALKAALAGALMRREAARANPAARDWGEFDAAWADASRATPRSPALALMHADRMTLAGDRDGALDYLEGVAKRSPRSAAVAVALADGLTRLGKPARALAVIERASAPGAAGDQAALRVARARALTALFRGREARDALVRDVDRLPQGDRAEVWVALGRLESSRGNAEAARQAYAEWAQLLPFDPRPRLVLLDIALEERNETAARALVEELKSIGGAGDVAYRLAQAKAMLWERDASNPPAGSRDVLLETAGTLVESVISDAPELPAAYLILGEVRERQGRTDEAIACYERAWDRGVEPALPRLVALLTRRGRPRFESLARLRETVVARGDAAKLDLLSAPALARGGETARAARAAEQLSRDLPESAEAVSWQARMLVHLGQVDDAEALYRATAERRKGEAEPWLDLIRFQARNKRTAAVAQTVARVKAEVKVDPPEWLGARCAWAAGDDAGAALGFAAAIAKRPDGVDLRLEAARFYEQTGRYADAEACLSRVLEAVPSNRPARRQLAVVLAGRAAGDPAAWARAWAALGPEDPAGGTPEDRLARAAVLARAPNAARRGETIGRLDALVADLPARHPVAHAARDFLARLLLEAGQPDRASKVAAVSASSDADPASILLYAEALRQGKHAEAAGWQLDRLAVLSPGDDREAVMRVRLGWDAARPVESAAALETAYTVREDRPGAESVGRETFLILSEGGPAAAAAAERVGRRVAARNPACSWMPALIAFRASRYDEALGLLLTAVRPPAGIEDLREACKTAMRIAGSTDDPETLRKVDLVLAGALGLEPNADEILVMRAMLRHAQSNFEDEVKLYRAVLAHRPDSFVVLNNLAWALSEGLDRPSEAMTYMDDLIKAAGRDVQGFDTRGMVLARLGKCDEAVRDLEEVVKTEPNAMHHFHIALVYKACNREADARRSWDLARRAGLTPREVDPAELTRFHQLLSAWK